MVIGRAIGALLCGTGMLGHAQDLHFQHLTTDDGLRDNAVTCMYEDREGYLWIGTEHGLDRYDGSSVWNVPGTAMHIIAVTGDRDGTIWAATKDQGLIRVASGASSVLRFRANDSSPAPLGSDQLTALYDLNDTTLLIGEREHTMLFFDKRTFACTYWADSLDLSPRKGRPTPPYTQGWCQALTPLNDTLLWVGMLHNGNSLLVDRRTLRTVRRMVVRRQGSESQTCAALFGDTLFTGGWQNDLDAVRLSPRRGTGVDVPVPILRYPVADEVNVLLRWDDHHLLAGTRGIGLFMVDVRTGMMKRYGRQRMEPGSIADDRIRALLRDKHGTLWVATANGLDRCTPAVWMMERTDLFGDQEMDHPELIFHRVEPHGPNEVRVFSSSGFFIVNDQGAVHHTPVLHQGRELQPTCFGPVINGSQVLGTEHGLVLWDDERGRITGLLDPVTLNGVTFRVGGMYQVRGLANAQRSGREILLAATLGFGVHAIDPVHRSVLGLAMPPYSHYDSGLALVNDLLQDGDRFWYATTAGVLHWSEGDDLIPVSFKSQGKGRVMAEGEDVRELLASEGQVWAIASAGELFKLSGAGEDRFTPPTELRSAFHGITVDGLGRFWITTDNGLLRFDPRNRSFLRVPVQDGARVRKLTRAITTLPDGRIAFCADNALFTFDPAAYEVLPDLPVPYILSATVAGEPVAVKEGRVDLSYRSGVIDIPISTLSYGYPQPPVIEYRLDGVEGDWRSIPAGEAIRYAGIPVGEHRLLVRVRDAFGRVDPDGMDRGTALLAIRVNGPAWQQWWFYAIALVLVSSGLYAFYNYRLKQAMKLQAVRNRIASDLHDEVGSSLSSITIGAQLATRLSPDASEQVKTLLARMGETSSASLRSISDIVWAIDPKNDEGEALVKRMRRIAQELLESKGVDVSFDVGAGVEDLKLPMNARKEIVLIYKEAVHNASKYSGASLVQISLHRRNGTLAVCVKDDGKGFDIALHSDGHGLGSMKRRAGTIGADLTLNSAPGMGTLVGVEVDLTRIRD